MSPQLQSEVVQLRQVNNHLMRYYNGCQATAGNTQEKLGARLSRSVSCHALTSLVKSDVFRCSRNYHFFQFIDHPIPKYIGVMFQDNQVTD